MWFYYEAVAKGSRQDAPSKRQVVIRIQLHRKDRPLWGYSADDHIVPEFRCPAPLGLIFSPDKVGFCHTVTFDETEGGVSDLCVEFVDPDDCARVRLVGPDIPPNGVLDGGIGAVSETDICVCSQAR